jgi:predicted transcriptional regulator of viral defense system
MAALAARQHGVVGRTQLVDLGLRRPEIGRLLHRGRLHPLHRGVHAVGHRNVTGLGLRMAAVLAAGKGAVLTHRSAGGLWGMRERSVRRVDVTVPRHRRARHGLVVHEALIESDERDVHEGIPVTTPARTLLDLAAVLDEHELACACERAEALRLGSPTSLQDLVDRYPRRKGTKNLKRLIEEHRIVPAATVNDSNAAS